MAFISAKFQFLPTPLRTKRDASPDVTNLSTRPVKPPRAIPRASDIVVSDRPRPVVQANRRLPVDAPVNICIYKYTDQAADLWDC